MNYDLEENTIITRSRKRKIDEEKNLTTIGVKSTQTPSKGIQTDSVICDNKNDGGDNKNDNNKSDNSDHDNKKIKRDDCENNYVMKIEDFKDILSLILTNKQQNLYDPQISSLKYMNENGNENGNENRNENRNENEDENEDPEYDPDDSSDSSDSEEREEIEEGEEEEAKEAKEAKEGDQNLITRIRNRRNKRNRENHEDEREEKEEEENAPVILLDIKKSRKKPKCRCRRCRKCSENNFTNKNCKKCIKCDICRIPDGKDIYRDLMYDKYFKELSEDKRIEYVKKRSDINEKLDDGIPIKYRILDSNLSLENKRIIIEKIDEYERLAPWSSEYFKMRKWIDGISKIPFEKYVEIPVNSHSKQRDKDKFLKNIYEVLNDNVFGQYEAKNKILQIVSQWITNPGSYGNVIGLQGPPGIGKTSLIKDGLSRALDKPFIFIPLGGAHDGSMLEGHSFTYEGSIWGAIVDGLMRAGCMNPIIFFDELDKISENDKSINGILMHLIDFTQNNSFHDLYFAGIDFDLSKALFIFSYNDESKICKILRDRITKIKLNGFSIEEKIIIASKYLIPSILKNLNIHSKNVEISGETIRYIIQKYTMEEGVRKLKENLDTIFHKINLIDQVSNEKILDLNYNIPKEENTIVVDNILATNLLEKEYYFGLNEREKLEFIKKKQDLSCMNELNTLTEDKIINLSVSNDSKKIILNKFREYEGLSSYDSDYYKIQKWVEGISRIPFGLYISLPVSHTDQENLLNQYLHDAQGILDASIYGQEHAKTTLLQMIAHWISNPDGIIYPIGLYGEPGTGKTSLIKEGLAKALGRPVHMLSLAGVRDSHLIKGHSYTYIGATWGKIVEILMNSSCMNPIIFFDELDKVPENGLEIIYAIMSLIDGTQNDKFQDEYFTGINFDLSKVIFIFSYNDEKMLHPILKTRLKQIKMNSFSLDEKVLIAKDYLLPKILDNFKFSRDNLIIDDRLIKNIILKYCNEEKGVRELYECLNTLVSKINLSKYQGGLEFPLFVSEKLIGEFLEAEKPKEEHYSFYI